MKRTVFAAALRSAVLSAAVLCAVTLAPLSAAVEYQAVADWLTPEHAVALAVVPKGAGATLARTEPVEARV